MVVQRPETTVIICAHNEAEYIGHCLRAVALAVQKLQSAEVIVVADNCTDGTVEVVKGFSARIVEKNWRRWQNSYAESLQTGYLEAKATRYVALVDADIIIPPDFFDRLSRRLNESVASVSSDLAVYPSSGFWNKIGYYWQKTYSVAPFGSKPWGACRLIARTALDEVEGFRDSYTPDSDLDLRLAMKGHSSILEPSLIAYHMRRIDAQKMINGQITSGRGRRQLGESLFRTMGHAVLRVRPFVIAGWLMERAREEGSSSAP